MTTQALLSQCQRLGIALSATSSRVLFDAPIGTMTEELRAEMAARKSELLEVLPRLAGMRVNATPIPTAKSATDAPGGPGRCFSCGVFHEHPQAYGRCAWCEIAVEVFYATHSIVSQSAVIAADDVVNRRTA